MTLGYYTPSPYYEHRPAEPTHVEVTPNAGLVVTVDEAKAQVRYATGLSEFDVEFNTFILAAQRAVEQYCAFNLLTTVWQDQYPFLDPIVPLYRRPFQSLQSIEYVAPDDGEITTLASNQYHTINAPMSMANVHLGQGLAWPETADRADAFRINYTVGWADAASVPSDIKQAILMTVAKIDADRGACEEGTKFAASVGETGWAIPKVAQALLAPYRYIQVYAT